MSTFLNLLNWLCIAVACLLLGLALWHGLKIEIGKPGGFHIEIEFYAAKRLFQ